MFVAVTMFVVVAAVILHTDSYYASNSTLSFHGLAKQPQPGGNYCCYWSLLLLFLFTASLLLDCSTLD